jgi:hypothetical protein
VPSEKFNIQPELIPVITAVPVVESQRNIVPLVASMHGKFSGHTFTWPKMSVIVTMVPAAAGLGLGLSVESGLALDVGAADVV